MRFQVSYTRFTQNGIKRDYMNRSQDHQIDLQDYVWRYFEFHANQRILLFRFYIAIFVFFGSAIGFSFIRFYNPGKLAEITVIVSSLTFIILTLIFQLLDRRNCQLIEYSKNALRDIELFHNFTPDSSRIFTKENLDANDKRSRISHKKCFSLIYSLAYVESMLAFFAAIFCYFHYS